MLGSRRARLILSAIYLGFGLRSGGFRAGLAVFAKRCAACVTGKSAVARCRILRMINGFVGTGVSLVGQLRP